MIARTMVWFLLAAGALFAAAPLPVLRIEPVTGGSVFFVKNPHTQPLTGFLIELVDYPGSSYSYWYDIPSAPIAPGAELRIPVANMTVGAVPDYVKLQAALFADGATAGVPEKVAQLTARREALRETMAELIRRLDKGEDLKAWADSLQPAGKPNRNSQAYINQSASRALILETMGKLKTSTPAEVIASLREMGTAATERR